MIKKSARRVLTVLAITVATVAIWRSGAVTAATLPVASLQPSVQKGLRTPTRLAVAADGTLYVADPANQGVLKYGPAGILLRKISVTGIPQGIAITTSGALWVCQKEFVALYDVNGAEIKRLGSGKGQFVSASGIAIDDTGLIYVADSKGRCVQVFDADGVYLTRFGSQGSGAGQFLYPAAIVYEKVSKQIVVVDSLNGRVQFFDKSGSFVRSMGGIGTGPLKFIHPQGIAFEYGAGSAVRMYICDAMLRNIQAIDPTGAGLFLGYVKGGKGTEHGSPSDLAFDQSAKLLYVVDGLGSVTVYKISDGNVVVDNATAPVTTAAVIASSPLASKNSSVVLSTPSTVSPLILSMVADGSTVTAELLDVTGIASNLSAVNVNGLPVAISNGIFGTAVLLHSGSNEITVTATDHTGRSWSEVRTVTKSTPLPSLTIATPDAQVTDKGIMALTGSVAKDLFVSVAGVPADISAGIWTSQVTLNPGINTVQLQTIDLNGQAVTQKRTLLYYPAAPALAITAPTEDLIVSAGSKVVISGTVSLSPAATVSAQVNGKPVKVAVCGGFFSFPVELVGEGVYTATVSAVTAAGNVGTITRSLIQGK